MQQMDSTTRYRDVSRTQRGAAEVPRIDKYVFPGSTPERQRVRRVVPNNPQASRTSDIMREQQIASATENAFNQFQQRRERQLTPEEVSQYAAWILQASGVLESMRINAEKGE